VRLLRALSMTSGLLKKSSGQMSYAQIVTIFLLVVAVGIAAFFYLSHQKDETTKGPMDFAHEQMGIEQKMLRELAKSENRSFSDEQVAALKNELSPLKGERVTIECTMGDLESCYLALEINLVFEASGWMVEEFLFAAQSTPGKAVIIRIKDASMRPRADDLARLLVSAGLSVTTQIDSEMMFALRIVIPSEKPPSTPETPA
jgi:hypothetical protein